MSDLMLLGVLRMPLEMAMSDELSRAQFHDRAQQAADRIEADADAIERMQNQVSAPLDVQSALEQLTDDQRMELFADYCRSCGRNDPRCRCWNDE